MTARDWFLRGGLVVVGVALAASLAYEGPPPRDLVHTHLAFRLFVGPSPADRVEFPLYNYAVRHPDVHIEEDALAGARADELVHVHRVGVTLGQFLSSLGLEVSPGRVVLDDAARAARNLHDGEVFEDDATHHWRLYLQPMNKTWWQLGDAEGTFEQTGRVDFARQALVGGDRLLLTYVPRDLTTQPDSQLAIQQESVLADLWRWPQVGGPRHGFLRDDRGEGLADGG